MITITGTNKIKGALDLSGINRQLKNGDVLPLTDNEFVDHTVQLAIKMGMITHERDDSISSDLNVPIKLQNIYDRPIRINALNDEVRPGQTFVLSEDQVNSTDIRGALAKGLISIVSSARSQDVVDGVNVRVGDLFNPEPEPKLESESSENTTHLDTNEELTDPSIIDTEDPKPIRTNDIPDPKGKTVVWNPNRDPVTHTKTQMNSVEADNSLIETNVEIDEISFVDKEMDQKRKESHPILKDKIEKLGSGNDGIDFL